MLTGGFGYAQPPVVHRPQMTKDSLRITGGVLVVWGVEGIDDFADRFLHKDLDESILLNELELLSYHLCNPAIAPVLVAAKIFHKAVACNASEEGGGDALDGLAENIGGHGQLQGGGDQFDRTPQNPQPGHGFTQRERQFLRILFAELTAIDLAKINNHLDIDGGSG